MLLIPLTSVAKPTLQSEQVEKQLQGEQKVPGEQLSEPQVDIGSLWMVAREVGAVAEDDTYTTWPDGKGHIQHSYVMCTFDMPKGHCLFNVARFEVTLTDDETGETIYSDKWMDWTRVSFLFPDSGCISCQKAHPIELEIGNGEPREITVYMSAKRIFPLFPLGGFSEDTGHLTIYFE